MFAWMSKTATCLFVLVHSEQYPRFVSLSQFLSTAIKLMTNLKRITNELDSSHVKFDLFQVFIGVLQSKQHFNISSFL
uniref:CSON007872 protein n=1 Tax=Culicoides sonorensis TaxID=179676 RepID=A0A336MXM9_CULSO